MKVTELTLVWIDALCRQVWLSLQLCSFTSTTTLWGLAAVSLHRQQETHSCHLLSLQRGQTQQPACEKHTWPKLKKKIKCSRALICKYGCSLTDLWRGPFLVVIKGFAVPCLTWFSDLISLCSFRWRSTFQLIFCQCICARGSVCQHHRDIGALSRRRCASCLTALVPGHRRGDLWCARDPSCAPQWHPSDLPDPPFQLQQTHPWQYLLLHSGEPLRENQEPRCSH